MTAAPAPDAPPGGAALLALVVPVFGAGYFLSYFLRNVNAILAPRIVAEFDLSASQIGLLTSLYFLSAAVVLIPVAIGLDRFGPRRMLMAQMVVAGAGCALFALGGTPAQLMLGRALIGVGVAGCLTTAFKAVTVWFPPRRWATGNSLVLGVGSLGVITGTRPLQWLLEFVTWRDVFWIAAALCLVVLLALIFAVPERNSAPATERQSSARVYLSVIGSPVFLRLMPVASLSMAVFFSLQGLWASAWMQDVAGLGAADIGARLLLMALAMSAGMLLNGSLGDLLTGLGVPLAALMALGLAALLAAQAVLIAGLAPRAWWPWAVMGYCGNIGALGYPLISRAFPAWASARAMSALAMSNFVLAFGVQASMGVLLDLWGQGPGGAYPPLAYAVALGVFLALQLAVFLWFLGARDLWRASPAPGAGQGGEM